MARLVESNDADSAAAALADAIDVAVEQDQFRRSRWPDEHGVGIDPTVGVVGQPVESGHGPAFRDAEGVRRRRQRQPRHQLGIASDLDAQPVGLVEG